MAYSPPRYPRFPLPTADDDRFMRALADDTDDLEESPWMSMGTLQYWSSSVLTHSLRVYGRQTGRPWFVASMLPIVYPWPLPPAWRAFDPGPMDAPAQGTTKQLAPDVMVALDVADEDRTSYDLVGEGVFPAFVLEVVSPTSVRRDHEEKVRAYDLLNAEEYAAFTPREGGASLLQGWRRGVNGRFEAWPLDDEGRLWSAVLGVFLCVEGEGLRAQTADGAWLPTLEEEMDLRRAAEAMRAEEAVRRQEAEDARMQEARARQQAEAGRQQAEAGRQQAEAANAQLRREIEELRGRG